MECVFRILWRTTCRQMQAFVLIVNLRSRGTRSSSKQPHLFAGCCSLCITNKQQLEKATIDIAIWHWDQTQCQNGMCFNLSQDRTDRANNRKVSINMDPLLDTKCCKKTQCVFSVCSNISFYIGYVSYICFSIGCQKSTSGTTLVLKNCIAELELPKCTLLPDKCDLRAVWIETPFQKMRWHLVWL